MTVEYTFKLRRGTAAEWTTANPVLAAGEPGVETDTDLFKFGDGATVWTGLDYANDTSGLVMSAPDILTAIKTVDGAGSGLDADLLDGSSSAAFETAGAAATAQSAAIAAAATDATSKADAATSTAAAALSAHAAAADPHPTYLTAAEGNAAYDATGAAASAQAASQPLTTVLTNTTSAFTTAQATKLSGIATGAEVNDSAAQILTKLLTVDGAASGLDADLLDGLSSAAFYQTGGTDVAVADGGTGSSTASGARTNLGLAIGTDVAAATAVARANHTGTQLASTISDLSTAAYIPGGTDVAVADGGTGSSTAAGARTSLGLVIGTNVQAQDADLDALAAISGVQGDVIYHNGTSWVRLGAGTATHVLTTGGAGANPAWAAAAGGSSDPLDANNIIAGRIFAR